MARRNPYLMPNFNSLGDRILPTKKRTTTTPPRPPGATPPTSDPFSFNPKDVAYIDQIYGGGKAKTDAQYAAAARGELDPVIKSITDSIRTKAAAAATSITAASNGLAESLGKIDYGAPYVGAEQKQAAVDAALQSSLTEGGANLAADLGSRLSSIGEPGVTGATAAGVAATGRAAGATQVAQGSNSLRALIAGEAAAREYGLKLPGIAKMQGLQDVNASNVSATTSLDDQTTQILAKLPDIVQALRSSDLSTRTSRLNALIGLTNARTKATAVSLAGQETTPVYTKNADGTLTKIADVPKGAKIYTKPTPGSDTQDIYQNDGKGHLTYVGTVPKGTKILGAPGSGKKAGAKGNGTITVAAGKIVAKQTQINQAVTRVAEIGKANGTSTDKFKGTTEHARVGGENYHLALHQAEAAVAPLLGLSANDPRLIQWVAQQLAPYFRAAKPKKRTAASTNPAAGSGPYGTAGDPRDPANFVG